MTSSSYMLERELLGSARTIIDAHSNTTLTQQPQQNTFRTSYGLSSQIPYTTTTSSYHQIGYGGNCPTESFESKKALSDVNLSIILHNDFSYQIDIFSYKIKCVY